MDAWGDVGSPEERPKAPRTSSRSYYRQLMQAILHDRLPIAKIVNATVITLDRAPEGYQQFDKGAAKKFVLDPHGAVKGSA